MNINDLKKYTKNLDSYTAAEVEELTPMTDEELEWYQHEIEHDTGDTSTWDDIRAIITFKQKITKYEEALKRYADDDNWDTYDGVSYMENGGSWTAKKALGIEED